MKFLTDQNDKSYLFPWALLFIIVLFGILVLGSSSNTKITHQSSFIKLSPTQPVQSIPAQVDQNTVYSIEDVVRHNSQADCWIIVKNKVYNVTQFLPSLAALKVNCGKDNTAIYDSLIKQYGQYADMLDTALYQYPIGKIE